MTTRALQAANKLEFDFESLSLSLRNSWCRQDSSEAAAVLQELSQLCPDLATAPEPATNASMAGSEPRFNYYDMLKLNAAATQQEIITSFFKQLHQMLKDKGRFTRSRNYIKLLNAAFVLRRPRLRLSHDLAAVAGWLQGGSSDCTAPESIKTADADLPPQEGVVLDTEAPLLLHLLEQSHMVSTDECRALLAQMKRAPGIKLRSLVLKVGYVSPEEMASLKLAEMLLENKQVTVQQIIVALYDERNCGVRMAESLQTRGWLPVQVQ
jgi:hypothetical protein